MLRCAFLGAALALFRAPDDGAPTAVYVPPPEYLVDTNDHKVQYWGELTVGDPPQTFRVLFDTGSSALVLPTVACKTKACSGHNRYDRSASHGAQQTDVTMAIAFGKGQVKGRMVRDSVCLARHVPLEMAFLQTQAEAQVRDDRACASVQFLAADEESGPWGDFPFDGLLGLGLEDGSGQKSALSQLAAAWPEPVFAVALRDSGPAELTVGTMPEGDIFWWPLSPVANGFWQISAKDLTLGDEALGLGEIEIAVDTGTSLLSVAPDIRSQLEQKLDTSCSHVNALPPLGLERADGARLEIWPSDYVRQEESGECKLALMPGFHAVNSQSVVLGDAFLRRYVVVFDYGQQRVGFALREDEDSHARAALMKAEQTPPPPTPPPSPTTTPAPPDLDPAHSYQNYVVPTPMPTPTMVQQLNTQLDDALGGMDLDGAFLRATKAQ